MEVATQLGDRDSNRLIRPLIHRLEGTTHNKFTIEDDYNK